MSDLRLVGHHALHQLAVHGRVVRGLLQNSLQQRRDVVLGTVRKLRDLKIIVENVWKSPNRAV